jgi:hypothetical protein
MRSDIHRRFRDVACVLYRPRAIKVALNTALKAAFMASMLVQGGRYGPMHIVFVTSIIPDGVPSTGYEIANAAILEALRRAGARVSVIGFAWPGRRPPVRPDVAVLGEVDVSTDNASAARKVAWLGAAIARGMTFSSVKLAALPAQQVRAALAGLGPCDAYVINSVQLAGAFPGLFRDRPSIYVAHNVEAQSAAANADAAPDPFQRMLFRREARLLAALEGELCARAAFVFTLAEEDRGLLRVSGDERSAVLPLVTGMTRPDRPRVVETNAALIGTWTWRPNRIGLDWFLNDVVPHLPLDFRVEIAGSAPADLACPHPGVRFVGRVADGVGFVRRAAVVPLVSRAGTGVQLKTIEAFELGLPCVATSSSLRGITHLPSNCIVADDPRRFAEAMVAIAGRAAPEVDGSAFTQSQAAGLDRAVRRGLDMLVARPGEIAA